MDDEWAKERIRNMSVRARVDSLCVPYCAGLKRYVTISLNVNVCISNIPSKRIFVHQPYFTRGRLAQRLECRIVFLALSTSN